MKVNKIKKIIGMGFLPIIKIIERSFDEKKIYETEKCLIKLIGRKDLNLGVLANLTDGGEGMSGWVMSEEQKEKIRNRVVTQETRERLSLAFKGRPSPFKGLTKENCEIVRIRAEIQSQKFKDGILKKKYGEENPNYGNRWNDEQKKKIADLQISRGKWKGDNNPNRIDATRTIGKNNTNSQYKYLIYDNENLIYDGYSLKEASRNLNINYNMLRKASTKFNKGYKYKNRYSVVREFWREL